MNSQLHARVNVSPVPDLPRQTRKFPPQSFCITRAGRTQAVSPGSPFISSHDLYFVSSCDTEVISSSVQTTECLGGRSGGTSMVFWPKKPTYVIALCRNEPQLTSLLDLLAGAIADDLP